MASSNYYKKIIELYINAFIPNNGKKFRGVYKIVNARNNKVYIGSSADICNRIVGHARRLDFCEHHSILLQRAYDAENLSFYAEIIELCTDDDILNTEQYYIDLYDSANPKCGYNISKIAGSPTKGIKLSDETKKKMSLAHKERGKLDWVKEYKSELMKDRWKNQEFRERHAQWVSISHKGKSLSQETKNKISITKKANPSNFWIGKKHSPESRVKMSLSAMGRLPVNTGKKFNKETCHYE